MKNNNKLLIPLISIIYFFALSLIQVNAKTIDSFKNKEIIIYYDNEYLYKTDSSGNEVGTLVPILDLMRSKITDKITLIEGTNPEEISHDSNKIVINTDLKIYEDNWKEYNTLVSKTLSPLLIALDSHHIETINDCIDKSVGFLYHLDEYSKIENLAGKSIFYDSLEELTRDIKNGTIDMAIVPQNEKLDLSYEKDITVQLKLSNQQKIPLMFSKSEDSKLLFKLLDEEIDKIETSIFNKKIYASENKFEILYLKNLLKDEIEKVKSQYKTINVNLNTNLFPYSYLDDGEYSGLAVQILNTFKEVTGIDYNLVDYSKETDSYNAILSDIKSNDLQISSTILKISSLKEDFLFSRSIYKSKLYVTKFKNNKDTNILDEKIGTSSKLYEYISENFSINNLFSYNTGIDLINALKKNEVDSIIIPETFMQYINLSMNNNLNFFIHSDLNMITEVSLTMNKDNAELNNLINEIIHHFYVFNPGNKDTLINNTTALNKDFAKHDFQKRVTIISSISIPVILILLLIVIRIRISKRKRLESEECDFIHPIINYYDSSDYNHLLRSHIEKNTEKIGVLLTWSVTNVVLSNNNYDKKRFFKFLKDYSDQITLILPESSMKFYLNDCKFSIYNDDIKNIDDANEFIELFSKKLLQLDFIYKEYEIKHKGSITIYNYDTSNIETLLEYSSFTHEEAIKHMESAMLPFDIETYVKEVNLSYKIEEVKKVIEKNQLFPVYQPIYNIQIGELFGFEGLSRTTNDNFGNIMDLLETSIISKNNFELSELMKENILRTFSESKYTDKKLFINIDASDINKLKANYNKDIELFSELNISSENIVMEVTEGYKITDYEYLNSICNFYKEKGITIALDDYGTGYSNLTHLIKLKPNLIKLDRGLISGINNDPYKQSIVKQFVELSKEINLLILGEGIETKEELEYLKSIGVTLGQGYFLGKPAKIE